MPGARTDSAVLDSVEFSPHNYMNTVSDAYASDTYDEQTQLEGRQLLSIETQRSDEIEFDLYVHDNLPSFLRILAHLPPPDHDSCSSTTSCTSARPTSGASTG